MVSSRATTVADYLAELPAERRAVLEPVLDVVRAHMPDGYAEGMAWGMIGWCVPLARYPDTYNGQPLSYVALAAQKRYYALYLSCVYQDPALMTQLREAHAARGLTLDMGKSCLRFRSLDGLALDAIGAIVASRSPEAFIARYEAVRAGR